MMFRYFLFLALLFPTVQAGAEDCRGPDSPERRVIQDLQRIVTPNGVDDTYTIPVAGVDHWINVRGKHAGNPLVLFVHGGPASPSMPSHWQFQRPLEEFFTLAHYDQRGAGKTHAGTADPASRVDRLHIDRFVDDLVAVAEHLRQRYGKEKLILAGHSWGSILGMKAALKRPDLFHAYVGIGQVINTRTNEELSFEFGLARARELGNEEAIAELESIAPYPGDQPLTRDRIVLARKWPQHFGGLNAYRNGDQDYYYGASLLSPEYDCADRKAFFSGSSYTLEHVLDEFLQVDFTGVVEFPVPVLMFLGRHDFTTPSGPTAAWLDRVDAPYKKAVWFEHSAHMIPWEEPGSFMLGLLRHVRPLATGADPEGIDGQP